LFRINNEIIYLVYWLWGIQLLPQGGYWMRNWK